MITMVMYAKIDVYKRQVPDATRLQPEGVVTGQGGMANQDGDPRAQAEGIAQALDVPRAIAGGGIGLAQPHPGDLALQARVIPDIDQHVTGDRGCRGARVAGDEARRGGDIGQPLVEPGRCV